jgi:hypothetical protein
MENVANKLDHFDKAGARLTDPAFWDDRSLMLVAVVYLYAFLRSQNILVHTDGRESAGQM